MISENVSNAAVMETVSTDLTELHRLNSILQRNNVTIANKRALAQENRSVQHEFNTSKLNVRGGLINDRTY